MRLLRYEENGGARLGAMADQDIIELDGQIPFKTMLAIVAGGEAALDVIRVTIARPDAPRRPLLGTRLLAPIERPGKYLAIGMNYQKHVEESARIGVAAPKRQLWFNKQTSCLSGPQDPIDPGVTEQLDYEVELAVVIGRSAKNVQVDDALSHVFGYMVANDVSARDWQFHSPTFTIGKSFDTHGPIGPWIVTADEIPDPQALTLRCTVNGEVRQESSTAEMIYKVADQIAYLSTAFTLEPGDLIATGTPEGVGVGMNPQRFLQPGDVVRCEVEAIGVIENLVTVPA